MALLLVRPLCFFDLETTGTQITKDRIVQIAFVKLYPNGQRESKSGLINPGISIPPNIAEIHGMTDEKV
ncbi:MAG: exonuclease domain-containing protein, partial [Bacteroidota bacterium]